ncbi:MAG: phage holin family protein [Sphingobacteriales bacterium]|nr:MAG: phage holin family protein [Sphingobacteriales bacterium]
MSWIIELLLNAAILVGLTYIMPSVKVRSFGTAILVALVISLLSVTVGLILQFVLNIFTLFLLSALVRLIVTALMIKLADKLFSGFEVRGFLPVFIIALIMAVVGTLLERM